MPSTRVEPLTTVHRATCWYIYLFDAHPIENAVKLRYQLDLVGVDTEVKSLVVGSVPQIDSRGHNHLR